MLETGPLGKYLCSLRFVIWLVQLHGAKTLLPPVLGSSDPITEMPSTSSDHSPTEARGDSPVARRERLRFTGFSYTRSPSGQVTCEVSLEWAPGETVIGRVQGQASPAGDARLGAEAAIRALESFTEGTISFELVGVKVVRAFDANVVIASLIQKGDSGPDRLLGCYLADGDMVRGAAIAVLNATNRVLGNYITTR